MILQIQSYNMTDHPNRLVALAADDADNREIFMNVCEGLETNLDILLFENGFELLDHLYTPDNQIPYILFLDINLIYN